MGTHNAVGLDGLRTEPQEVLAENDGDPDPVGKVYDIIIAGWRGGGMPCTWKDTITKVLPTKMGKAECDIYRGTSLLTQPQQNTLKIIASRFSDYYCRCEENIVPEEPRGFSNVNLELNTRFVV